MPAAVAGRGWMGSPAASLGVGESRVQSSAGGQISGRSYRSAPSCAPTCTAALLLPCKGGSANCEQIAL